MDTQSFLIGLMIMITAGISAQLIARAVGMKLHKDMPLSANVFYITLVLSMLYGLAWVARYVKEAWF